MIRTNRLSVVADSLLSLVERDPRCPHYGEESFERKLKMATRREIRLPLGKLDPSAGYLLRREWLIIGRLAALTARQHDIFFKRISGWTFEEIGREAGHSKQGAQNIFRQALKKICRSEYVYPYAGLSEVYQAEIRRGRFAKRR